MAGFVVPLHAACVATVAHGSAAAASSTDLLRNGARSRKRRSGNVAFFSPSVRELRVLFRGRLEELREKEAAVPLRREGQSVARDHHLLGGRASPAVCIACACVVMLKSAGAQGHKNDNFVD